MQSTKIYDAKEAYKLDYKNAVNQFIRECDFFDEIEVVFLTGSYASNNQDMWSDIDLYILLSDSADWRERGSKRVENYRIEYFANPKKQIESYIEKAFLDAKTIEITMILGGEVVYDRNGTAKDLIDYCRKEQQRKFPPLSPPQIKMQCYSLFDSFDELTRSFHTDSPDFFLHCSLFFERATNFYARFLLSPIPPIDHFYRWIIDSGYRERYGLPPFPDSEFLAKALAFFSDETTPKRYTAAESIYQHIISAVGGFDADNFKLHSPCDL